MSTFILLCKISSKWSVTKNLQDDESINDENMNKRNRLIAIKVKIINFLKLWNSCCKDLSDADVKFAIIKSSTFKISELTCLRCFRISLIIMITFLVKYQIWKHKIMNIKCIWFSLFITAEHIITSFNEFTALLKLSIFDSLVESILIKFNWFHEISLNLKFCQAAVKIVEIVHCWVKALNFNSVKSVLANLNWFHEISLNLKFCWKAVKIVEITYC